MTDIHPGPQAGDGKPRPRNTTYKPGDRIIELRPCAQCGLPFRIGKDAEGDSQDSPGITRNSLAVAVSNNLERLPQPLKPSVHEGGTKTSSIIIHYAAAGPVTYNGLSNNNPGFPLFQISDGNGNTYTAAVGVSIFGFGDFTINCIADAVGPIVPTGVLTLVNPITNVSSPSYPGSNVTNPTVIGTSASILPLPLADFYGSSVTVSDPVVSSGCRFCGSLNSRAVGRDKDFEIGYKNMENR